MPKTKFTTHYSGPASKSFWRAVGKLKGAAWNEAYATGVELQNLEERALKLVAPTTEETS